MSLYSGQCLCGEIKYQVDKVSSKMAHCHCSMCRKFHGAAFATFGQALVEDFRWIKGQQLLQSYKADNGTIRKFCSRCGSSLIFEPANNKGAVIEFTLASLDDSATFSPDAHIYLSSKVDWIVLNDNLTKFSNGRTS